jgi:carbonic anhydrase
MVIAILLLGVPAGVIASGPGTAGSHAPLLSDPRPPGILTGWNMLLAGLPGIEGMLTENSTSPSSLASTGAKSPLVDQLLRGNEEFRENVFNADPELYKSLAQGQSPDILWIGCSDSRSDPERITHSQPGELFVTRNVGNIVPGHDWSLVTVVEYAVNYLEVQEIVVVGHSDCGAMKALDKDLLDPYIPLWLNDAREAKTRVDARISNAQTPEDPKERAHQIELENVRLQIEHLMTYPSVREAVDEGRVQVHGLYYDLATGTLSRVT